jgi:hypothetical protein
MLCTAVHRRSTIMKTMRSSILITPLTSIKHSMHASKQHISLILTLPTPRLHQIPHPPRPHDKSPQRDSMSKTRVKVPQLSRPNSGNQNTGDLRLISKFGLFHGYMNPTSLLVRKRLVDGLFFPFLLPLFHRDRKGSARDRIGLGWLGCVGWEGEW